MKFQLNNSPLSYITEQYEYGEFLLHFYILYGGI